MPFRHVRLILGHFQCPFSLDLAGTCICKFSQTWLYIHCNVIPEWGTSGVVIHDVMRTLICLFVTFV